MSASLQAFQDIWPSPSTYGSLAVRTWAKQYLEDGKLAPHMQGKNSKRPSLMNDEDFKQSVISWIRDQKPERRSVVELKKFVDEELIPHQLGLCGSISTSTLRKYLHEWGFQYRKNAKDIYVDGHERPEVVAYRQDWAKRMMKYRALMCEFTGDLRETVIEPVLNPGETKHVLVTHDECTFYANGGKQDMWLQEGETFIRKKKTPGMSIMVSEFQCACHGTMRSRAWTSRKTFCAGANREGYWKGEDVVQQLVRDAIPLFDLLHPDCTAVFVFDQSSNHNAYKNDALVASRMTLKPKIALESDAYKFRETTYQYTTDGVKYAQSMYYTEPETFTTKKGKRVTKDVTYCKGIKMILTERGLWTEDDPQRPGKKWRVDCDDKNTPTQDNRCCARHLLAAEPDFQAQKTAIREVVESAGHIFELYPKFHCECNWIERYWGAAKREARLNCDYSSKALQDNLPRFLDSTGALSKIRNYYYRYWRYIDAYSRNMEGYKPRAPCYAMTGSKRRNHDSIMLKSPCL